MLTQDEQDKIVAAIAEAERHTGGEIVVVVARASADYGAQRLAFAGLAALATPLLLLFLTQLSAQRIYLAQLIVFASMLAVTALPGLRMALSPKATQRRRADEAAFAQFHARDVARTQTRAGVLIFCSVAERHARIVADVAVAAKVPEASWASAIEALTNEAAQGRLAEGCLAAVALCGDVLAQTIPRSADDVNERPDAVYQI
jgi:putative membrane protein